MRIGRVLDCVRRHSIFQITPRRMISPQRSRVGITPDDPITDFRLRDTPTPRAPVIARIKRKLIIVLGAGGDAIVEGGDVIEFWKDLRRGAAVVGVQKVRLTVDGEDVGGGV